MQYMSGRGRSNVVLHAIMIACMEDSFGVEGRKACSSQCMCFHKLGVAHLFTIAFIMNVNVFD